VVSIRITIPTAAVCLPPQPCSSSFLFAPCFVVDGSCKRPPLICFLLRLESITRPEGERSSTCDNQNSPTIGLAGIEIRHPDNHSASRRTLHLPPSHPIYFSTLGTRHLHRPRLHSDIPIVIFYNHKPSLNHRSHRAVSWVSVACPTILVLRFRQANTNVLGTQRLGILQFTRNHRSSPSAVDVKILSLYRSLQLFVTYICSRSQAEYRHWFIHHRNYSAGERHKRHTPCRSESSALLLGYSVVGSDRWI